MAKKVLELTPSEVYAFITMALRCGEVPYIGGDTAIGKSSVIHSVAHDANALVIDDRLSQKLPEDMTGIPEKNLDTGKAEYLPFDHIPLEGDPIPEGYSGWFWFLDELSSGSEEILAAAYSIILDHMVGGRKIHPKCRVIAAGNLSTNSAIARALPDTLITRMAPCIMKVNTTDWCIWAEGSKNRNDSVINFIKKNPTMLYTPTDQKERQELESYGQPRGWEKVMKITNLHEKINQAQEQVDSAGVPTGKFNAMQPLSDTAYHLMVGAVGPICARSFRDEYNDAIALPTAWEVAQSPASARIPTNQVGKAKLTDELGEYFLQSDQQTRNAILRYMNRIGGEFAVLFVNKIKDGLPMTSQSDHKLVEEVTNRLSVDPLLGTAPKGDAPDDNSIPF